jgi:hypothetical protein
MHAVAENEENPKKEPKRTPNKKSFARNFSPKQKKMGKSKRL